MPYKPAKVDFETLDALMDHGLDASTALPWKGQIDDTIDRLDESSAFDADLSGSQDQGERGEWTYLDTGPSIAGWSRLSTFMKCPYLFGRRYRQSLDPLRLAAVSPRRSGLKTWDDARALGTTGHAGMAHWLARIGAEQGGIIAADAFYDDASLIAPPEDAIEVTGRKMGLSKPGIDGILATFRNYVRTNGGKPPGRPIAVESMVIAVVGWRGRDRDRMERAITEDGPIGEYGFWVVRHFDKRADWLQALDGQWVRVARLTNLPKMRDGGDNPREGQPIFLTRRLDATFCTSTLAHLRFDGTRVDAISSQLAALGLKVDIDDHKFSAMPFGPSRVEHYEQDGQFACARVMGHQVYGSAFDKVMLNSIHRVAGYEHGRAEMIPTGFDCQLAWQIERWEEAIAFEEAVSDVAYWRRDQREANCKTEMGRCDLYWHCRDDWAA